MIDALLFAAFLFAFAFTVAYFGEAVVVDSPITCNCGRRATFKYTVVDAIDIRKIREILTELCDVCRCNRDAAHRDASVVKGVSHAADG